MLILTRLSLQSARMFSNNGTVGNMFSSSSGFQNDLYCSLTPDSQQGRLSCNTSYISKSPVVRTSMPHPHSSQTEVQPVAVTDYPEENRDIYWGSDSLQSFLNISENIPPQSCHVENSSGAMPSVYHHKKSELQDLADHFLSVDEDPDWGKLLADVDANNTMPKVAFRCSTISPISHNLFDGILNSHFVLGIGI